MMRCVCAFASLEYNCVEVDEDVRDKESVKVEDMLGADEEILISS